MSDNDAHDRAAVKPPPEDVATDSSTPGAGQSSSIAQKSELEPELPENGSGDQALRPGSVEQRFSENQAAFGRILLIILGGSIVAMVFLYSTKNITGLGSDDLRDLGSLIVVPLTTLVASVVGFYFGERRKY